MSIAPHYRPSQDRVPVGVATVVRQGDSVLMIRRTGAHGEGKWSIPGGWINEGEEPSKAAWRETWEEVGITLNTMKFLGYTSDVHPEGLHGITLWFESDDWLGHARNTNPDRISDVEWWPVERLRAALRDDLFLPLSNGLDKGLV